MKLKEQLKTFVPIDLKQMDRVKLLRSDTKYLISKKSIRFVTPIIRDYFILEIDNRITAYHTAYLDTPDKRIISTTIRGEIKDIKFVLEPMLSHAYPLAKLKEKGKRIKRESQVHNTIL